MQCGQADSCRFENDAKGSGSSLWTFKLEFGIVHTINCSVCRSYMTHVAVANHSGDASFKDALNNREDRVSTAFLDGLQGGRQIQQEHDSPILSRYRDERDKALQDLEAAKREMAILRDRFLALELAAQVLERESKRRGGSTSSSTESPTKSDMSSAERLLPSPSEDLDNLSTPCLLAADDHDSPLIPDLPTVAEGKDVLQTETPDIANPLGSSSSIKSLRETAVSTEKAPQTPALLFKPSSETPEPEKPSPQPSTCALSLSNHSRSDQRSSTVEPPGETDVSTTNAPKPRSRVQLAKPSSTTPKPEELSPTSTLISLNPSSTDQQSLSVVSLEKTNGSTTNVPKAFSSATPEPAMPSPTCTLSSLNLSTDQQSLSVKSLGATNVSTANLSKRLDKVSSAASEPAKTSPTLALISSNPTIPDRQSSSVGDAGEIIVSTANELKGWAQLAKAPSSATPKSDLSSSRPPSCPLNMSNLSTSDQQSSCVEPPGEAIISTANVPKHRAQLAKASPSATPEPAKLSPRASICALSSSNPSNSNQQFSSVGLLGETNMSTANASKSWAQLLAKPSSAALKLEKPSPRLSTHALSLSNSSSDHQSSSVLTSRSPRPLTTIAHVEALMKAAHGGDESSLTRIRAFCGTARRTPRKQRTELQRYALLHWRKPSPSVSSSVPSSATSSELGTVHTTLGDGMFSTEIHVDSSAWGIGFIMDGLWLAWKFSNSLAPPGNSIDNNWAEMLAVEVGLWTVIHWVCSVIQKEGDVIESLEIIVCSDNAGVVKAIDKRHSNFPPQQDILLRILDMVSEYDIKLSMKWISSMDNCADGPSRGVPGPAPDLLPLIPPLPSYLSDILVLP